MGNDEVVRAWHDALNTGDAERIVELSTDDVALGGPRGPARGAAVLRDWVVRSGVSLVPGRIFAREGVVVVEQQARWRNPEGGGLTEPQTVASVFLVSAGRVTSVVRHPDLRAALDAGGLGDADERQRPA